MKPESNNNNFNNNNTNYNNNYEEKKENDGILHQTAEKIRSIEAKITALKKEYPTCTYYLNIGLKYGGYVAIGVGAAISAPVSLPAAVAIGKELYRFLYFSIFF